MNEKTEKVVETTADEVKEETIVEKKKLNFKKIGKIAAAVATVVAAIAGGVVIGKKLNDDESNDCVYLNEPDDGNDYTETAYSETEETTETNED